VIWPAEDLAHTGARSASGERSEARVGLCDYKPCYAEARRRTLERTGLGEDFESLCFCLAPSCALGTGSSETMVSYTEFYHSTLEVSAWRCHRREYTADL
jgi:hypothetical protein